MMARWHTTSAGEEAVSRWWRGEYGTRGRFLKWALAPAEGLFRAVVWLRNSAYDAGFLAAARAQIPIVSVGNLTVGGSGKTPVSAWIVDQLIERGHRPALLHGGYAEDEPALHRAWHPEIPVFADRNRIESARRAYACGATVAVLDDGYQYRNLKKDLEVLLVSAEAWQRRPRLLPNGPWREAPAMAAGRADLILVTRKTATPARVDRVVTDLRALAGSVPISAAHLCPAGFRRGDGTPGRPAGEAVAVAGVAQPELFAENVRDLGVEIGAVLVFPDHHDYTGEDVQRILAVAGERAVVTTEKDWIKLGALMDPERVWLLEQQVEIEAGADAVARALDGVPL